MEIAVLDTCEKEVVIKLVLQEIKIPQVRKEQEA
jgi:hypothetical protein